MKGGWGEGGDLEGEARKLCFFQMWIGSRVGDLRTKVLKGDSSPSGNNGVLVGSVPKGYLYANTIFI